VVVALLTAMDDLAFLFENARFKWHPLCNVPRMTPSRWYTESSVSCTIPGIQITSTLKRLYRVMRMLDIRCSRDTTLIYPAGHCVTVHVRGCLHACRVDGTDHDTTMAKMHSEGSLHVICKSWSCSCSCSLGPKQTKQTILPRLFV
jgi:hypothetical protein